MLIPPQPKFGRENVDYLLNDEVDPRYENVKCSVKDCLDLAHFNKDHQNQTVRKLNKKSDLMEFRSEHGWDTPNVEQFEGQVEHEVRRQAK